MVVKEQKVKKCMIGEYTRKIVYTCADCAKHHCTSECIVSSKRLCDGRCDGAKFNHRSCYSFVCKNFVPATMTNPIKRSI